MADETMDVEEQVRRLNAALRLQFRSAIQYTLTAGGLAGFEFQPLAATPWEAIEHRLEHIIMRKQEQVDVLLRASRPRS